MITLEEQIRRYAADVAGPVQGPPPPLRDGERGPTPVGRLVLVAVLVVFVASFAWLVVRAMGSTAEEHMVPAEPSVPAPTSWGGEPGMCTDTMAGIPLEGPDGEGLCLGIDPTEPRGIEVAHVVKGERSGAWILTECDTSQADWSLNSAGPGLANGGRRAVFWTVSPSVERMVVPLQSGKRITAQTIELPGLDGLRLAGYWIEADDDIGGRLDLYTADGEPYVPTGEAPDLPAGCPGAQPGPLVPTPSDSEEWETPVLDHQGQTRGRTAGLVDLVDGLRAYRVVDDADLLVGYTLLDQAVGFVDRDQAEDPERLRTIVACGEEQAGRTIRRRRVCRAG